MADFYANAFAIAGLMGVAFYLGDTRPLQLGFIQGSGYAYTLLNLFGASFVLISLATEFNLASALIQISWITISIIGLTRLFLRNRKLQFSEDEHKLMQDRLAELPKWSARAFFNAGGWTDLPAGEVLLREGAPVGHLFYLADGGVAVSSRGLNITRVENGFLGEINVIEGAPASATVRTEQPSRVFVIARHALTDLFAKDADLRSAIEASLSREMGQRLMQANRQIVSATAAE